MIGILRSDPKTPAVTPVVFRSITILPDEVIGELDIVRSFVDTIPTLVTLPDPTSVDPAAVTCPELFIVNIGMLDADP